MILRRDLYNSLNKPLAYILSNLYSREELQSLYLQTVLPLFGGPDPMQCKPHGPKKKLLKDFFVQTFLKIFGTDSGTRQYFKSLPQETRRILDHLAWNDVCTVLEAEKALGIQLASFTRGRDGYSFSVETKLSGSALWVLVAPADTLSSSSSRGGTDYFREHSKILLPPALKQLWRACSRKPPHYYLQGLQEFPAPNENPVLTFKVSAEGPADLWQLTNFIRLGNLKTGKSGAILVGTLKKLLPIIGDREFFPDSTLGKELNFQRLQIILALLHKVFPLYRIPDAPAPEPFLQSFYTNLPKALKEHSNALSRHLLPYLSEGWTRLDENMFKDLSGFTELLRLFPQDLWISLSNLETFTKYHQHFLCPDPQGLYEAKIKSRTPRGYYDHYGTTTTITEDNFLDVIHKPMLRMASFLMASIGCLEIAYTLPREQSPWKLNRSGVDFLTPFDGLLALRLTSLGAWVLGLDWGKAPQTELAESADQGLTLDPSDLIARAPLESTILRVFLEDYFETLAPGLYRLTRRSLAKGCSTAEQFEIRVQEFCDKVPTGLPALWEEFLDKIMSEVHDLQPVNQYLVLDLKSLPEIRQLVASDPELRRLTNKMEGYRLAFLQKDRNQIRERLRTLGYFLPLT